MISSNIEAIIIKVAAFGMYSDSEQCCLLKLQWTNSQHKRKKKQRNRSTFLDNKSCYKHKEIKKQTKKTPQQKTKPV